MCRRINNRWFIKLTKYNTRLKLKCPCNGHGLINCITPHNREILWIAIVLFTEKRGKVSLLLIRYEVRRSQDNVFTVKCAEKFWRKVFSFFRVQRNKVRWLYKWPVWCDFGPRDSPLLSLLCHMSTYNTVHQWWGWKCVWMFCFLMQEGGSQKVREVVFVGCSKG